MTLCKHEIEEGTCSVELHGTFHDSYGGERRVDVLAHQLWPAIEPNYYPSDNGCPSQAQFDAAQRANDERRASCLACGSLDDEYGTYYDDHTCGHTEWVVRPTATEFLDPVGHPVWYHEYEFGGTRFLGFYRNQLDAIAGFGLDPSFMAIH